MLSILMIVKDAGVVIRKALVSLQGLGDELVVVDSGSTDATKTIARKFTNKLYAVVFQQDFSELRNIGLSKVSGDWILVLDADEQLAQETKREIPYLIRNSTIDGYWFRRKTFVSPNRYLHYGLFYPDWQLRLFRNRKEYRYRGTVHEQLAIPKEKTREVSYDILHYPQHPKYTSFTNFRNLLPYIQIQAGELLKSPRDVLGLFVTGVEQFFKLFFGGFLRGKGFLDGWAGFRAHIMFASSIAFAHILAGWRKIKIAKRPVVLLFFSLLGLHLIILIFTNFTDWPEMLLYPWFLSKGLIYYQDVVLAYVPGAYYLLYGFYKILGFTPSSLRIIAYIFVFVSDLLLFWISLKLFKKRLICTVVLLFFMLWQPIFTGNTIWYETMLLPFYLLAFYFYYRFLLTEKSKYLLISGLTFACSLLIKQTAVLPVVFSIIFLLILKRSKKALIHGTMVLAISVIPLLLVWVYYAFQGVGSSFFYWVFVFPTQLTKADCYYLLAPSLGDIALIGPAYLPTFFLTVVGLFIWRKKQQVWPIVFIIGWSIALFFAGSPRWGMHRLVPSLAFSALALGYILVLIKKKAYTKTWNKFVVFIFLVVLVLGFIRSFGKFIFMREKNATQFWGNEYINLGNFVLREIGNAKFFVFGNYDYLYFFFDRKPSVFPWTPMFPWNGKVAGIQEAIVTSLEQTKIPYILYIPYHKNSRFYLDYYPELLGDYIFSKYTKLTPLPAGGWLLKRIENE